MAAPSKALLAPTTLNSSSMYKSFTNTSIRIGSIKLANLFASAIPVFNNQLGLKFAIPVPYINTSFIKTNITIKPIKNSNMYMIINTFPAVYTPVVLRPSYGQLWPISGSMPY